MDGSAPRVRGTRALRRDHLPRDRFSPACAGNACFAPVPETTVTVQPRVCGERKPSPVLDDAAHGSAPRVRGTRPTRRASLCVSRFSPACAGNAFQDQRGRHPAAVQPRVCGERHAAPFGNTNSSGSAPRVRGTLKSISADEFDTRFSPACAGNAAAVSVLLPTPPVQPRVCGERNIANSTRGAIVGSAPRVRGTLTLRQDRRNERRFSPACAGNACSRSPCWKPGAVQPRVCGERKTVGGIGP